LLLLCSFRRSAGAVSVWTLNTDQRALTSQCSFCGSAVVHGFARPSVQGGGLQEFGNETCGKRGRSIAEKEARIYK
jgi:hypothetical protein